MDKSRIAKDNVWSIDCVLVSGLFKLRTSYICMIQNFDMKTDEFSVICQYFPQQFFPLSYAYKDFAATTGLILSYHIAITVVHVKVTP